MTQEKHPAEDRKFPYVWNLSHWRVAGRMPPVSLARNEDGSYTATILSTSFTGTRGECVAWLRANGEEVP